MIVTYWGVRGSMPSPGSHTVRYGGNTACVSVAKGDNVLVIDAGTGIRGLGKALKGSNRRIFLALSHRHYDHVLGFPLFAPLFEEGREIFLICYPDDADGWTPLKLMDGIFWPVQPHELRAEIRVVGDDGFRMLADAGLDVRTVPVNHPGGALGFRIEDSTGSFVHITDNELCPPDEPTTSYRQLVEFCKGVDVLSHDAQYLENEMPAKEGWGHSLVATTCKFAVDAGARSVVLFHHDPDRSDDALDRIGERSFEMVSTYGTAVAVAYEGFEMDLATRHSDARLELAPGGASQ